MLIGISIACVVILIVIGAPMFISFIGGAIVYIAFDPALSLMTSSHIIFGGLDKWILLAIPFFVLAGNLMASGGTAKYLVELLDSLVGHLPGGLSIAAVLACMIFSALSGSGPATAVAIGTIMVGPMVARGYNKKYSMGVIATTGTLGNVIPPSIAFIIVGSLTETDVGMLFMAGLLPGIFIGLVIAVVAVFVARRTGYDKKSAASWRDRGRAFVKAIPALLMPVIILGGIYSGMFTPTEAAAVACVYALIASSIYRELNLAKFRDAMFETMRMTATLFILIGGALLFAYVLTYVKIPQAFTGLIIGANLSPVAFLFCTLVMLGLMGCILDAAPIIFITLPIMWPAAMGLGIDPIHMCVFMLIAIIAGQATPPVGINLFAMSALTKERIEDVAVGAVPFFVAEYLAMIVILLVPALSTWLPGLMS